MIVPVMAISNLVLTRQIYSEETNGAHAHYREPVPLTLCFHLGQLRGRVGGQFPRNVQWSEALLFFLKRDTIHFKKRIDKLIIFDIVCLWHFSTFYLIIETIRLHISACLRKKVKGLFIEERALSLYNYIELVYRLSAQIIRNTEMI